MGASRNAECELNADEYAEEQLAFDQRLALMTDACLDAKSAGMTVEGDPNEFLAVLAVLRAARRDLPMIRTIADSMMSSRSATTDSVQAAEKILALCDRIAGARRESPESSARDEAR